MKTVLIYACLLAVIVTAMWLEMQVWDECRQTNSFWYCMRVLSK